MQAGQLRHRVSVEASTETRDAHGGPIRTWAASEVVWAAVRPLAGRELIEAQQVQPRVTHRVTMRYLPSLTASKRIIYGDRTFEIQAVMHTDERGHETIALCMEA